MKKQVTFWIKTQKFLCGTISRPLLNHISIPTTTSQHVLFSTSLTQFKTTKSSKIESTPNSSSPLSAWYPQNHEFSLQEFVQRMQPLLLSEVETITNLKQFSSYWALLAAEFQTKKLDTLDQQFVNQKLGAPEEVKEQEILSRQEVAEELEKLDKEKKPRGRPKKISQLNDSQAVQQYLEALYYGYLAYYQLHDYTKAFLEFSKMIFLWNETQQNASISETTKFLMQRILFSAYYHRGTIYAIHFENPSFALVDLDKAIALNPQFENSFINKGVLFLQYNFTTQLQQEEASGKSLSKEEVLQKQISMAIEMYTKALELNPNNKIALTNRGMIYMKTGQEQKAVEDFTKTLSIDPNDLSALFCRAKITAPTSPNEAVKDLSRCIEVAPKNSAFYMERGLIFASVLNLPDRALQDYKKVIELKPDSAAAHCDLGMVYHRHFGDLEKALFHFTRSIELDKNNSIAYTNRGMIYRLQEDFKKAMQDFNKSIDLNPLESQNYYMRALLYSEHFNEPKKAIQDFNKVIEMEPDEPSGYNARGVVYIYNLNQPLEAIKDFTKALSLDPKDPEAHYNIATIYHAILHKPEQALGHYNAACQLNPENGTFFEARAYLYRDRIGNVEAAQQDFATARKLQLKKDKDLRNTSQSFYKSVGSSLRKLLPSK